MTSFERILKEPLLHFLLIGAVIFAGYWLARPPAQATGGRLIEITPDQASVIAGQYQGVWNRPPSVSELQSLIDAQIREEALAREARFLSLDSNDPVIRRRLNQKMRFLIESLAGAQAPSPEDLAAYYEANAEKYTSAATYDFDQVFLGETPPEDEAKAVIEALNNGGDPAQHGQRSLLPANLSAANGAIIDRTFGTGFGDAVAAGEVGRWVGPVRSGYGFHAIRLTRAVPSEVPALEDIADRVADDWTRENAQTLVDAQIEKLLATYSVSRPTDAELEIALQ